MSRVQITLDQVQDFITQGFEVEYFVKLRPQGKKSRRLAKGRRTGPMTPVRICLEGTNPEHGDFGDAWKKIRAKMSHQRTYKRQDFVDAFLKEGISLASASSLVARLIYHHKCLRIVDEED